MLLLVEHLELPGLEDFGESVFLHRKSSKSGSSIACPGNESPWWLISSIFLHVPCRFVLESVAAADPGKSVRSLQREINTLAKLEHPNIIKVQLFFLEEELRTKKLCAYVQYPVCSEGSMDAWLEVARGEPDSHSRIRVVLWDALKGLEHVHFHGIVHCDIKLANVRVKTPCVPFLVFLAASCRDAEACRASTRHHALDVRLCGACSSHVRACRRAVQLVVACAVC